MNNIIVIGDPDRNRHNKRVVNREVKFSADRDNTEIAEGI